MQSVINWIIDNWQLVVSALIFILSFILQIIKKKPINAMVALISEWSIEGIKIAEDTDLKGINKLAVAVQFVLNKIHDNFPKINPDEYRQFTIKTIENILSTPEKKQ